MAYGSLLAGMGARKAGEWALNRVRKGTALLKKMRDSERSGSKPQPKPKKEAAQETYKQAGEGVRKKVKKKRMTGKQALAELDEQGL